ncbi:enhanced serine sensitivity protein SseB C-terminal domain-containing protein [Anaerovorax sp. IOR16]|uniref:enhanced serine sensitivity protein SseB C-terminal domain-containing protein n=1 Tax=Anaerovorax sp. IOR16 TaxID=2773458 RepID=UPI0019CF60EA|nr:enhanced serine sensitivity protein SseB C-terminal domain-containing protein [Anaerovorax sp. IOR16]
MSLERKSNFLKALNELQKNTNAMNEENFFKILKQSMFWVPVHKANNEKDIKEKYNILTSPNGDYYLPAFFEKKDVCEFFSTYEIKYLSYDYLKHMIIDDAEILKGIVINPFKENIIITQALIYAVDEQIEGMTVNKEHHEGNVQLWQPTEIPKGLLRELKKFFEMHLEVHAAWLLKAQGQSQSEKHWLLLIDFYGDKKVLFPKIAETMRPFMKPTECFELMQAGGSFKEKVQEVSNPIYVRKTMYVS